MRRNALDSTLSNNHKLELNEPPPEHAKHTPYKGASHPCTEQATGEARETHGGAATP